MVKTWTAGEGFGKAYRFTASLPVLTCFAPPQLSHMCQAQARLSRSRDDRSRKQRSA